MFAFLRSRTAAAFVAATLSLHLHALPAAAQNDKAGAEAMLGEGLSLKKAGKYELACPKFEESLRLFPSLNTEYHLADCYEHVGKIASAWIDFVEIESKAKSAGETAKAKKARERADAIAAKVPHLTITVPHEVPGIEVKREGVPVGKGQWGSSLPVDAGTYAITATAPGKKPWSGSVTVKTDGAPATLDLPALEDAAATTTGIATPAPPTETKTTTTGADTTSGGSSARTIGLVVGVVGVVGMGVGAGLALAAKSAYDGASCQGSVCDSAGVDARDAARSKGNVATLVFGLGAVATAAGVVLWLTAPSSKGTHASAPPLRMGIAPSGFVLGGSF